MVFMTIRQHGLFQEKLKQGGLRIYFFENPPGIFHFFTLPQEIPDKTKLIHLHKIVLDPFWKFQGQKQTPLEIPSNFPWSPLEIPLCFY